MNLPSFYLRRPEFALTPEVKAEFDEIFDRGIASGTNDFLEYSCSAPKWQFLSYLGDTKDVLFHGTGDSTIAEFEPRQSNDSVEFGNQKAVYAASDGLWASYFAVMDRDRYVRSLVNSCIHLVQPDGTRDPYYYFSINEDALPHQPWRSGTVYLLPRETFERQPSQRSKTTGLDTEPTQWRSFVPVKPLSKISVRPEEFPFLGQVRGHDVAVVNKRSVENPDGFPWHDR